MTEFWLARTRFDWFRFSAMIFGAIVVICSAVFGHHSRALTVLEITGAALFVVLAFMVISTDPRVRRLASWGVPRSRLP